MALRVTRTKLLPRNAPERDARLVVIATEDTYASPQYFDALQRADLVHRTAVKLVVHPPKEGQTAPSHLIDKLDAYKAGLSQGLDEDEYWLVFDVDHRKNKELSAASTLAGQKGYRLAGSNPCFEVWLLLHEQEDLSAITTYAEDSAAAAVCEKTLRAILGSYNKTRIDASRYHRASVSDAIDRARASDSKEPWPSSVGTHLHRLVERILAP